MHTANPAINAIVVDLSAQAIEAARAADRALAQGATPGKLQGVPVTIKINIDVEGQANSNGVVAFKDNIAPGDSPVTANLKKAGAIIIGMTNTPEFSMRGFTDNPLHGPTLNPWDSTITCGGSSGGAGASIASGIGAIAHGNDIGGSLRWPAYCNGIATIKPTQGRIPAFNPSAPVERPLIAQFMSAQGPLAREVRDVRLGLEVMSQRDMRDPWWVPAPLEGPSPAKPIKVALARIPDDMETDAAVLALLRTAAGHLVDAGYDVVETEVPDLTGTWRLWCDLIMTELSVLQEAQMRELGSADFRQTLDGSEDGDDPRQARLHGGYRPPISRLARLARLPRGVSGDADAALGKADAGSECRSRRRCARPFAVLERPAVHVVDQRPWPPSRCRPNRSRGRQPRGRAAHWVALPRRRLPGRRRYDRGQGGHHGKATVGAYLIRPARRARALGKTTVLGGPSVSSTGRSST
jgi:Asp-tRNA(Asn)/Glu-tRNA(Gln) amidotransferase A subunit family amidase